MDDEIKRLNGEGIKVQQQLTPEQQNLLIASHKLVANKAFGWSRLFADLEAVFVQFRDLLPRHVVLLVRPKVEAFGDEERGTELVFREDWPRDREV